MTSQNKEYYRILKDKNLKGITSSIREGDARKTGLHSDSIDLIITSPPYAISYEYADLHQLTLLWFKFTENMNSTKQKFIGTASGQEHFSEEITFLAKKIVSKLSKKDKSLAKQISRYYSDLGLVYQEMRRILKKGKRACIILGDTEYKKVKIKNTEVSIELLRNSGFEVEQVIKRKLSSKTFTPYRDQEGKFTNSSHGQKKKIYQWEYIIIAKKQ
ncbi:MAG: hypothetical protein KJ905_00150 [Nanoarchaeota archaeon]|nr:hypothetical protein [Nanoarchaeota archaeon]MBU1501172.1 hypothetical protein [Nanoarchaeota archaeon]